VLASKEEKPCDYGVLVIKKKKIYIYIRFWAWVALFGPRVNQPPAVCVRV
jgi:hypothetical protein